MRGIGALLALSAAALTGCGRAAPAPIIDMHLHANAADAQGPPPVAVCAPYGAMPGRDARWDPPTYAARTFKQTHCRRPVWSSRTDDALRDETLAELRRLNITAVTSGDPERVEAWRRADPRRIVPAVAFDASTLPKLDELRALHRAGRLAVLGEIGVQYDGWAPDDPRLEPYYALAEELDVPVAIHVGPGPPGAPYLGMTAYRMALSDPLRLESVLVRHPRLRLYVMHAGWPNADAMIALLYAHPQVYVDTGVIDWSQPRAEFHRHLRRLVEAGYGDRIMFGSDQMVWPGVIAPAVRAVTSAPFLSERQKRAILYDNARRFLRWDERGAPNGAVARSTIDTAAAR